MYKVFLYCSNIFVITKVCFLEYDQRVSVLINYHDKQEQHRVHISVFVQPFFLLLLYQNRLCNKHNKFLATQVNIFMQMSLFQ